MVDRKAENWKLTLTGNPFLDGTQPIPKSVRYLNWNQPGVSDIKAILDKNKIRYEHPTWREEVSAHIGIPSLKFAVFIRSGGGDVKNAQIRERWNAIGWLVTFLTPRQILNMKAKGILEVELLGALEIRRKGGLHVETR